MVIISLPPGQLLLSKLVEMHMLPPSVVGKKGDRSYSRGIFLVLLLGFWGTLWLIVGAIFPKFGYLTGNFFTIHGTVGRIICGLAAFQFSLGPLFHSQMLSLKTAPFIQEILAYDNQRQKTVLPGEYRMKMATFIRNVVTIIVFMANLAFVNVMVGIIGIGIITPLYKEGFTVRNALFWLGWYAFNISLLALYITRFMIYPLGLWFLCKSHLDRQTDYLIDRMIEICNSPKLSDDDEIISLETYYRDLVVRTKEFDEFSREIITPYRLDMSLTSAAMIFASHQQDNYYFTIGLDVVMITVYAASLTFLSTGASLSTKRTAAYTIANQLFAKTTKRLKSHIWHADKGSIRQLTILCRLIKSLGDESRPSICLTDKSDREYEPMEFVDFVYESVSSFFLAATLYWDHVQ